ncbi:MAG: fimbrillin family protein, partial [Segatella oulorum]
DGQNYGPSNVSGTWDWGWNFNNKITSPDAPVYFPASGRRDNDNGSLSVVGHYGHYWSAVPYDRYSGCELYFNSGRVDPHSAIGCSYGTSVRPVAESKPRVTPKTPGSSVEAWQEEELDGGHGRQQ